VPRQAARVRTPEELATQLEDAFIVRDQSGLADRFDEHAVMAPCDSDIEVRGRADIAIFAAAQWTVDRRYLANVRRVVQTGDTAAIVVDWSLRGWRSLAGTAERGRGVGVLRRGSDGAWRYVISLLHVCERSKGAER
jgi:ketosteroid isomerase-like protein